MNWRIIRTLVVKDLTLYFRNRFFAFITVLALVAYAVMYFLMPGAVDEEIEIGLYAPSMPSGFTAELREEGVILRTAASEEALKEAVGQEEYPVGVVLSADILEKLAAGQKDQVRVYFSPGFPDELKDAYVILFEELAFNLVGQPLNVDASEEVLGIDTAGAQIPPRDRMLPLFAVFVLLMETLGLASLISSEIEGRTIGALLITPMRIEGLFVGKGITGVGLAFTQAVILMTVTGGLDREPALILVALLLGALLSTGIAFMIASVARDMMSVIGWGVLAIVGLSIPAFSVLLPGTISDWIKVIPSHYLVDTVHRAANFGIGWGEAGQNLLILLAFALAFLWLGAIVLRRKFR
jgi:ABC-2 type transport system permease protein